MRAHYGRIYNAVTMQYTMCAWSAQGTHMTMSLYASHPISGFQRPNPAQL